MRQEDSRVMRDLASPWGTHAPGIAARALLAAARLGLGHGRMKGVFARWWRHLHGNGPVDVRYAGLRVRLFPADNTIESKMLFSARRREATELALLCGLPRREVFVDIGANSGYYTLMLLACGYRRALAFEPNPAVFERMRLNLELNGLAGRAGLFNLGLGDRTGEMTLHLDPRDLGSSSLCRGEVPMEGGSLRVPVRPLRKVLDEAGVRAIDALKIDVEGFEDRVLLPYLNATEPARWPRVVVMEHVNRDRWQEDVLDWMLRHGYGERWRSRGNVILERTNP